VISLRAKTCERKTVKSQCSSNGSPRMAVVRPFCLSRTAFSEEIASLFLRSLSGHFSLVLLRLRQHACANAFVNIVRNLLCRFRRGLAWSAFYFRRRLQLLFQVRYLVLQFFDCINVRKVLFFKNLDKESLIDSQFFRSRLFLQNLSLIFQRSSSIFKSFGFFFRSCFYAQVGSP